MACSQQAGIFSSLGPWGLPLTPVLTFILTYYIDTFVTPTQFFGISTRKNDSYEQVVERARLAAKNLQESMPLFVFTSLVAWYAGVDPRVQNLCHLVWFAGRVLYKWAYMQYILSLRTLS
ncbi:hypothetical protein BC567DRAFT_259028 [Phyllosticta citribraziliensis]